MESILNHWIESEWSQYLITKLEATKG